MFKKIKFIAKVTLVLVAAVSVISCRSIIKIDSDIDLNLASQVEILRKDLSGAVYKLSYDQANDSLFVATAQDGRGVIYRLDPNTLAIKQEIKLEYGAFDLALNKNSDVLYVSHTLDGAVTAIDAKTGKEIASVEFDDAKVSDGVRPRNIVVDEDNNILYVGGENQKDPGAIWILSGDKLSVEKILQQDEGFGLFYDPTDSVLYSSRQNFNSFSAKTQNIKDLIKVTDKKDGLLLNIAIDKVRNLAYVTDFKNNDLLVFDLKQNKLQKRITTASGPMDIKYNPIRQEVYVTNRFASKVTVYDANDWSVLKTYDVEQYPNSLALDKTGQYLYVSVKKEVKNKKISEAVVRINLNAK